MAQLDSSQTGARLLVRCLEAQGVPFIFGIPGGAVSPILDALADGGPQFITASSRRGDLCPRRTRPGLPAPHAESRRISRAIALPVATAAQEDGLATPRGAEELERLVEAKIWEPCYLPITLERKV